AAIAGVAPEDDDGNAAAASVRDKHAPKPQQTKEPELSQDQKDWRDHIATLDDADAFTAEISKVKAVEDAGLRDFAKRQLVRAATAKGYVFDEKAKRFVVPQPGEEAA